MKIGDRYELQSAVTPENTAEALGSGGMPVFATPFMITMMEGAAYHCIKDSLPEGKSSVGTLVHISHVSPSPIGMKIRATAEITAISENGKMVDFKVEAYDEQGLIGEGTHQRAIVDMVRFNQKCQDKLTHS